MYVFDWIAVSWSMDESDGRLSYQPVPVSGELKRRVQVWCDDRRRDASTIISNIYKPYGEYGWSAVGTMQLAAVAGRLLLQHDIGWSAVANRGFGISNFDYQLTIVTERLGYSLSLVITVTATELRFGCPTFCPTTTLSRAIS